MARKTIIWGVVLLGCTVRAISALDEDNPQEYMSKEDREMLKEEARDMFYHAYNAYMDNAYPADELMPLSCKGRYRNSEPDRGDIDSALGNFSLTLVDTLDTLVVLGDLGEFENAVRLVVRDVTFDTDVIVSLFETNIRMLGGLLSGHILAEYLQSRADIMPWYRGELLNLAKDLGYRFLPAFNTTTGIPFGRINLRHGMKGVPAEMCRETCTACAGSMILEMAALSRLTGESIFEDKAQKAMDALWKIRHRGTDLMGSVLNVHSGDWVRRDSGVGAGIDSYYEYCLKAYILLGDEKYLGRFNRHYQAVMKYVSQGPMLLDVHMHRPNTNSKNFMDALLAFWPGLQVLKGDIKPAVETHEMLYQVMQRHNFIPEAFTTDFQIHWGHHPLRPEFLESTYFLYRATGDHYYLEVGRKVLKSLQTYARVLCGYAAVSDVRTNKHDDTMDSFVLSETLKYLYLLFAEPSDLVLDLDEFIFTTEGHLLPLSLAAVRTNVTADLDRDIVQVDEIGRTCPNSLHLFPASVRQPLRNMVEDVCPRRSVKRRISASQFQPNNLEHLKILSNMGITILTPSAGQVQVLHTFSNARTAQDAEEGLLFMQEMVELSKKQSEQTETKPMSVTFVKNDESSPREVTLMAGPAHFGPKLKDGKRVTGTIEFANPLEACGKLLEPEKLAGKIVVVSRGNCMFVDKARRIQKAGAIAGIVIDDVPRSSAAESPMFAMSGDEREPDDVTIPVVFLFTREAARLVIAHVADNSVAVTIGDYTPRDDVQLNAPSDPSVLDRLKNTLKDFIARQLTSENLASRVTESRATPSEAVNIATGGQSPKEYQVGNLHLKALVFEKAGIIKIVRTGIPPPSPKKPEFAHEYEKSWYATNQDLVNMIYLSGEGTLVLPLLKVRYTWIQTLRGHGMAVNVDKIPMTNLISWFLTELRDIAPDTSGPTKSPKTSMLGLPELDRKSSLHDPNWKSTFGELEVAIAQLGNDIDALHKISGDQKSRDWERKIEEKLAWLSFATPLQRTLVKLADDLHARLRVTKGAKLQEYGDISIAHFQLKEIIDYLKTIGVTQKLEVTLDAEFKEFRLYLISDTVEATTRNIPSGLESESMITYEEFSALISRDKTTFELSIKEREENSPVRETIEPPKSEDFERTWYDLRQFIVNLVHSYDDKTLTIPVTAAAAHYHAVLVLRLIYQSTSVEYMIMWYLNELGKLRPQPEIVVMLRTRRMQKTSRNQPTSDDESFLALLAERQKNDACVDSPSNEETTMANHERAKTRQDNKHLIDEL